MHERDKRDQAQMERLRKEAALEFEALDRRGFSERLLSIECAERSRLGNKKERMPLRLLAVQSLES